MDEIIGPFAGLGSDIWLLIMNLTDSSRDAAALSCVSVKIASVAKESKWRSLVRLDRYGTVLAPLSGYDIIVIEGEDVQSAIDRCPVGGSVLLMPGRHLGPLVLSADRLVHIFGNSLAYLWSSVGDVVTSFCAASTLDSIFIEADDVFGGLLGDVGLGVGVMIHCGRPRFQSCDFFGSCQEAVSIKGGADPYFSKCKFRNLDESESIKIMGIGTRGHFENCEISGGCWVTEKADPEFVSSSIRGNTGVFFNDSKGTLRNCDIFDSPIGIRLCNGADPFFSKCTVRNGSSRGVLILNDHTKGTFVDCDISGNEVANVEIKDGADPTFLDCKIHHGQNCGVNISDFFTGGKMKNCDIFNNGAANVRIMGGNPYFSTCKIYDGRASGVYISGRDSMGGLKSCEIWGNLTSGIEIINLATPIFNACIIRDGETGVSIENSSVLLRKCRIIGHRSKSLIVKKKGLRPRLRDCYIEGEIQM